MGTAELAVRRRLSEVAKMHLESAKWTDIAIVILTAGIVGVSALQWHEMHSGSADTHDLAVAAKAQADASKAQADAAVKSEADTHALAVQAVNQAEAAKKAVGTLDRMAKDSEHSVGTMQAEAEKALTATIEASKADQRAWFGISDFEVLYYDPIDSSTPFRMQIIFRNSGKTPALRVRLATRMWASDSIVDGPGDAEIRQVEDSVKATRERYVTAPGASRKAIFLDNGTARNMVTSNYKAIQERKRFFYFFGQIDYDDVYQRPHTTRFCLWLAEPETKQLAHCENDNEMN
jgi:hypothetical protein